MSVDGKTVVVAGTFSKSRKLVEAVVKSSVSGKTQILVCGAKAGGKLAKAQKLNLPIVNEELLIPDELLRDNLCSAKTMCSATLPVTVTYWGHPLPADLRSFYAQLLRWHHKDDYWYDEQVHGTIHVMPAKTVLEQVGTSLMRMRRCPSIGPRCCQPEAELSAAGASVAR